MLDWTEDERLGALHDHGVLDTAAEEDFDTIVRAAAAACGAPMAAVSLVDRHRQWFKARVGLDVAETPRDVSFCAHAIQGGEALMVVPDATADDRFADNALVTGDPDLRFYAGAVIRSEDGLPLGALCVLDTRSRPQGLSAEQAYMLKVLAEQVSEQLKLRRAVRRMHAEAGLQARAIAASLGREDRLLRALDAGGVAWWEWDVRDDRVVGSHDLAAIFGISPQVVREGAPIAEFFANVHDFDRRTVTRAVEDAVATGADFHEEYRVAAPGAPLRWISAQGRCLYDDGRPTCFPGVIVDITPRRLAEARLREADVGRQLAMGAARLGSWDHNPSTGVRRYDARALEMVGLSAEQVADVDQVVRIIHPEDRERVVRAIRAATEPTRSGPFEATYRVVHALSGETRWLQATGRTEFTEGVCTRFIGVLDDVTDETLAQEHRQLLVDELEHRVKNSLTLAASIVDATLRGAADLKSGREAVATRLATLGRAHDLLTASNWSASGIGAIVDSVILNLGLGRSRLEVEGPPLLLGPRPALQLSLTLHELATNAVKYGALSNDTGRVRICWEVRRDAGTRMLAFTWTERGGPPVQAPTRRGFGSRLINVATAAAFDGRSELDYEPSGVRWRLTAPFDPLQDLGRPGAGPGGPDPDAPAA